VRHGRYRAVAQIVSWGILACCLWWLAQRGVASPGWFLAPLLVLLITCLLGIATGLMQAIARRWACQFNENSKSPAHFAEFPELNHNEIVGWRGGGAGDLYKRVVLLSLEDRDDHEMTRHQTEIGLGIEQSLAAGVHRFDGGQGGRLSRMISLLMLGDFASIYLAFLNGVDPTPVENIDYLKNKLGQLSG